jgi:Spy/CpxP family protein refolding chaperone
MKTFLRLLGIAALALTATAGLALAQPGSGPHGGPPAGAPGDGSCGDCPCGGMGPGMGAGPGMGPGMMHGPGMGPGRHLDHLVRALDLTAEQQASLQTLRDELQATVQPLFEAKRAAGEQLHEAIQAGSTDALALGNLVIQAHGNDAAIKAAHDTFEASFVALLTPEQQTKYEAIKDLRPRGPRGRHHGGPPVGN